MPDDAQTIVSYPDDAALIQDALDLLALRLDRETLTVRAARGEVDGPAPQSLEAQIADRASRMTRRFAASPNLALPRLVCALALSDIEVEILLIVAAPAFDPRIGKVYAFLHDDVGLTAPSLGLIHMLMHGRADLADLRAALDPALPLRRYRLVLRGDGAREHGLAAAPLVAEDAVIDLLLGRQAADGALAGLVLAIPPTAVRGPVHGDAAILPVALACAGDPGGAALAIAAGLGCPAHHLDWSAWRRLPPAEIRGRLARAFRAARLAPALPVLDGFEAAPDGVLRALAEDAEAPLVLATGGPGFWQEVGVACEPLHVQPTDRATQQAVWAAAGGAGTAPELPLFDLPRLVGEACSTDHDMAALDLAVRARARREMAGVATEVRSVFTLDDLVLPRTTEARLRAIVARQRVAAQVRGDWGLDAAYDARAGTCALFAGPSGTGKTAAAAAIGTAIGLPVWRVDLAGTISKYIGETEKNLDRVFAAAARARVLLVFDEADALFGKRSEVSDSHDRYANIQVSYLLQRIESHEGVVILATNLQQNMDEAFLRRIDHAVWFPAPGPAERRRLWARLEESGAPIGADLDLDLVAARFDLTGGAIRTCALAAAEAAAIRGGPIAMAEVMQAIAQELAKTGRPISKADFAGFGTDLRGM